jgi:hypothetical protein
MRRREFIMLLGGTALGPLAARAQQPAIPVVALTQVGAGQRLPALCGRIPSGPRRDRLC